MRMSRVQTIFIAFFIISVIVSYLLAHWLHEAKSTIIKNELILERDLNRSTQKLLMNCEAIEKKEDDRYSPNFQICEQGLQEREQTSDTMNRLVQEESRNEWLWYRNFFLSLTLLNLIALLVYRCYEFLKREEK